MINLKSLKVKICHKFIRLCDIILHLKGWTFNNILIYINMYYMLWDITMSYYNVSLYTSYIENVLFIRYILYTPTKC